MGRQRHQDLRRGCHRGAGVRRYGSKFPCQQLTDDKSSQRWWNEFEDGVGSILNPDNKYYRPILFYAENATNLDISGIHLKDSPCWNNFIVSSKNVRYTDVVATALSNNGSVIAKNTDFMNTLNTSSVSIERVWVNIDDDCFSPKPNSSDLYVNTMYCNGTHGQVCDL